MARTWNGHRAPHSGRLSHPTVRSVGQKQPALAPAAAQGRPRLGWARGAAIPARSCGDGAGTRSRRCSGRRRIPGTALLRKSLATEPGAGKRGRAILTLGPRLRPARLRETGWAGWLRLRAALRPGSVRSPAPGSPPHPTPKISTGHPAGSCFQHSPGSLGGLCSPAPPPWPPHLPVPPAWPRFSSFPGQPVIHAHSPGSVPGKPRGAAQGHIWR